MLCRCTWRRVPRSLHPGYCERDKCKLRAYTRAFSSGGMVGVRGWGGGGNTKSGAPTPAPADICSGYNLPSLPPHSAAGLRRGAVVGLTWGGGRHGVGILSTLWGKLFLSRSYVFPDCSLQGMEGGGFAVYASMWWRWYNVGMKMRGGSKGWGVMAAMGRRMNKWELRWGRATFCELGYTGRTAEKQWIQTL